ncbi:hypothetical protein AYO41_02555 [Verrucomicrobia bacterium SCGC AG-212-E04]|nr:hypothetical protein AYO41_02555 [Verrucomicrobia bacterium SCGC AG-212-E04]
MRFQTTDGLSYVQLDRRDDDGYAVFDVTAVIEEFAGRNKSVIFTGCTDFLRQLRAFDAKRAGTVTLEGTEQCRLSVATFDGAGHMRVDIRLCRYSYQPGPKTTILTLEGGFDFDVEFANSLFKQMHELLRDCS